MKCYVPLVFLVWLLLIFACLVVNGGEWTVADVLRYGTNKIQALADASKLYQPLDRVDKNDIGTADDRDKTLDDKVTVREAFHTAYEGYLEKTEFFSLSPDEQKDVESTLSNDPGYIFTTKICEEITKSFVKCNEKYPYRAYDGTCNNLENPTWGSVLECVKRLFGPHYENVNEFRKSVTGNPLPNPRTLSQNLHNNMNNPTDFLCHMNMFYGQFLDHDMTKTAVSTANGIDLQCCAPLKSSHPQCAPILLSKDDSFYKQFNKTCINFARTAPCASCALEKRTQMNTVTAYIDGSHLYGTSKKKADELRAMDGTGKLKSQDSEFGELLPPNLSKRDDCGDISRKEYCFDAGDPRVNEHTPIMSLHTSFMRFHNRMCEGLKKVNPDWDDEKLYQVARKIVGAVLQHISYQEWLIWTIGEDLMNEYSLWPKKGVERTSYNPKMDASVHTEFATAAFRLHSIIGKTVTAFKLEDNKRTLRKLYNQAGPIYHGEMSNLITGVIKTAEQDQDRSLVDDVRNFLYRPRGASYGIDLAAINIQRGRDNGLPPYYKVVAFCSGEEIRNFDDLLQLMSKENVERLKSNYKNVADIDLWSGIQLEEPIEDAVVGSTAGCVIAQGFQRRKFGDRFYYENGNPNVFTDDQLKEIKKMSLSALFCQVTDIQKISKFAFLCPSDENPVVNCEDLPAIDLSKWKE